MTTEERLLRAAERRVRANGYNGFSFRDLADDAGLTNAGVHHHFRTKADLVARLTEDYTARFLEALDAAPAEHKVRRLRTLFAEGLRSEGHVCLCGVLAAESAGLPDRVVAATRGFFEALVDHLCRSWNGVESPRARAQTVLARLEGAMLLAHILGDPQVFDTATADLQDPSLG